MDGCVKGGGGSEKGGVKIHPFHLPWIRACFLLLAIDHFHKWQRTCYSIAFMLIRFGGPNLVSIFFWILLVAARLERLSSIKTKEC